MIHDNASRQVDNETMLCAHGHEHCLLDNWSVLLFISSTLLWVICYRTGVVGVGRSKFTLRE